MALMRLTSIEVTDFLALPSLQLEVDGDLTVVTGANGVGKSTLLAACTLAKRAVAASIVGDATLLEADWADSARDAGAAFEVRLGLSFDRGDERALLDNFFIAALLPLVHAANGLADQVEQALTKLLDASPAHELTRGALVVRFDATQRQRWLVGWEFELSVGLAHVGLLGPGIGELAHGPVRFERTSTARRAELTGQTNNILEKLQAGEVRVRLSEIVAGQALEFRVQPTGDRREPPTVQAVLAACTQGNSLRGEAIMFARVFDALFTRRLLVTPNHRKQARSIFHPAELGETPDLSDGSMLAVELHRLKNGDAAERRQFHMIQERLTLLTGQRVECRQMIVPSDSGPMVQLTPVLQEPDEDGFDVPLQRAGAGVVEALYLSAILADDRHVVLLDEPAVHLSPTAQRRLLAFLRSQKRAGQVVMVTHNPDVVPVRDANDLRAIVRLNRNCGEVRADRLPKEVLERPDRAIQLLASTELRNVLFAAGVVLCEGATDLALLRSWTDQGLTTGSGRLLHSSEDLNLVFYSVDGDTAFIPTIRFLRSIGIPWVVLSDGPALRPGRQLARYVEREQLTELPSAGSLDEAREAWARAGVYSLAVEFGDPMTKSGEIEAFMQTLAPDAFDAAIASVDTKKGGRVGAAFAAMVPPPPVVADLWAQICNRLVGTDP